MSQDRPPAEAALVLFSGGQDSTVCLAWALRRYGWVETVGFDYGQRHGVEMAARERVQMAQLLVERGVAGRIEVDVLRIAAQAVGGFAQLDTGVVEQLQPGCQPVVQGRELAQLGMRSTQCPAQGELALAIEQFHHAGAAFRQAVGVGQALVVGLQFGQFGGWQRPLLQFRQFMAQQLQPKFAILAATELVHALVQLAPLLRLAAHLGDQVIVARISVEQGQLMGPREQRLVFMLAVDLDQQGGQLSELARVGGAAVDPGAGAAFGTQHSPQLAVAVFVEFLPAQPCLRVGQSGQIELRGQLGAVAVRADHAAVGACAGQQHQRVDQQRLAGAGLAADHGQAGAERHLGGLDDGKMADIERSEHGQFGIGMGEL